MRTPTMVALVMLLQSCTYEDPELGKNQQAEIIEVHGGCPPGQLGNGEICVDPLEGGGSPGAPGGGGGEQSPIGGPGGGGGGETVPEIKMDPEPDRNKNRHSCEDWCAWNMRQCEKECWHRYPDVVRDFWSRTVCLDACKTSKDPNHGLEACRGDCQKRFPERP